MYRHYRPPVGYNPAEARRFIRQAMEAAAELRQDTDTLPRVQADGSSECPFSERAYYDKEKTAQFVRDDLNELQGFLKSSTACIAFLQNKIHELGYKRESLHGEAAQDHFASAELKLVEEMRVHQHLRSDLKDAIAEVEATLRESGAKQFPGGDPRGPYGQRVYREPRVPQPIEKLTKDNAKEEIERMLRGTREL